MISPSGASPVLAMEAQYGRNLPGELVRHFQEYVAAKHGDAYFGVFTTTGKLHLSYADGHLPGDIPLQIIRTYDSGQPDAVGFSTGWTLNYYKQISKNLLQGTLTLSNGTGLGIVFTQDLGDFRQDLRRDSQEDSEIIVNYLPPADEATGIGSIQENASTNVLTVKYDDGSRMIFEPTGVVYRPTRLEGADSDRYVELTYNVSNQLTKIENNNGAYFDLTYLNGKIHTIEGSDALDWTYTYNLAGRLVTVDRPDGSDLEYGYDVNGRLDSVKDPLDHEWQYTHNGLSGKVTGIEDPTGSTIGFTYYNGYTSITDRNGNSLRYDFAQPAGYTTKVTDGEGNYTELSRDSYGNIEWFDDKEDNRWGFDYDSYHQCVEIEDPATNTMSFEYAGPAAVLPTEFTDRNGHSTVYDYDELCNLTTATDAMDNQVEYEYNSTSQMTKITDRRDYEWDFEYATYGQVNKITFPDDNYVQFAFDTSGNRTSYTDARGNETTYEHDELGRLTKTTDPLENETTYQYDNAGNLTKKTLPDDTEYNYVFDCLNRRTAVTDPLEHTSYTHYSPVGTVTKRTDAEGNDTHYEYDDAYHITKTTDAEGNETEYAYDNNGNVTQITDANDHTFVSYEYNCLNQVVEQTDALDRYSTFAYDDAGNLASRTDPLGDTTTFTYDVLNRLVSKQFEDDSWLGYQHDANGNLTEASDGTVTFKFTFDSRNRTTSVRDDTQGLEVGYSYDANGNLATVEDTGDNTIGYYYDKLNHVTDIANGSTYATIQYSQCCGVRTKLTLGNGCYTEYTYDDGKRLTRLANKKSDDTIISAWDYAYDDVGNVTSQTDKDDAMTAYTYDDIYRLTDVDYPTGNDFGYEYDGVGNRTEMYEYANPTVTTSYTYDAADELTQYEVGDQTVTFGYALDGSLTSKSDGTDTWTYVWDQQRRLQAFKENGDTLVEYGYNPTGTRRFVSDTGSGVKNYFCSKGHVLADYDSDWTMTRSYVLGPSVDEIIAMTDPTAELNPTYYFMRDRLGSTRELVNASETIKTRYAYDVWGDPSETQLSGSVSSEYRFTGREYDPTSGLYYYRARYYANELGRFVSRDPLYQRTRAFVQPYAYVSDNPARFTDPSGLCGMEVSYGASLQMSVLQGSLSGGMLSSVGGGETLVLGNQAQGTGTGTTDPAPPGTEEAFAASLKSAMSSRFPPGWDPYPNSKSSCEICTERCAEWDFGGFNSHEECWHEMCGKTGVCGP